MSGLGILVVVAFVVLAVMDNLRKVGKGTTVPRGGTRMPPRIPGRPYPSEGNRADAPAESAETLLPEDLWALLTGQQRPPVRRPTPPPLPARPEQVDEADLEDTTMSLEPSSFETVSATAQPADGAQAAPNVPAALAGPAAPAVPAILPPSVALGLRDRRDLRRAVALQIVLGRPRSLE